MPPRTLASLAQSLSIAPDLSTALIALGEVVSELDRTAWVTLFRYDERRGLVRERLTPVGDTIEQTAVETAFDHVPVALRNAISTGGQFVDFADKSEEFARLFGLRGIPDGGLLSMRGLLTDARLSGIIALYEPRKFFGTRTSERFAPSAALFDLAYMRFAERDAREDAVRTLEDVTQKVHGDYLRKLSTLERELSDARRASHTGGSEAARVLELERDLADAREESRRRAKHLDAVEQQIGAAVGKLEQAHVELHRRSDLLRQKTRTLYLIEKMIRLHAETTEARQLAEGLINLLGDDMQAQRCSLMLAAADGQSLYLAASRGPEPGIPEGERVAIGERIAGRVAASREPLLVQDVEQARAHPILQDQFLKSGSFISFPLELHETLIGVVNLTNKERQGVFTEEDVERVSILGLVMSLIVAHARLPERLLVASHAA